ncbi:glycosyltransferase [Niabella yanshanensis]|uniref:Glycosyltransferase n=1 Tax=Niabella yanshanensis TaxID=577386 RepID=A0ABZ0W7B6_9BACT|nr:glycosyltransferase [Niabella yanshanensis]WQD38382.1 glycosyltransferase [Niabella yanshanensis]
MNQKIDLIVFSHLRWYFVYQRPQHLISRFAQMYRTIYIEEPVFKNGDNGYSICYDQSGVLVITPEMNHAHDSDTDAVMTKILQQIFQDLAVRKYIIWYYTPMALPFTRHLDPMLTVYDCMDELSAFKFAPPALLELEKELLSKATLVFTGGRSLYEHKRAQSSAPVHCFPSSIDKSHFNKARLLQSDTDDQHHIPFPRFGFFGVIDERFDIDLIDAVAAQKTEWQFILIGPVVKIDEATLPRRNNIHYLGPKKYEELPAYISSWDVAILPFAVNESTRFISPTKTPEYLAAGKPVIATPIRDVIDPYGTLGFVKIVYDVASFIAYGEEELATKDMHKWQRIDAYLDTMSWDSTWNEMHHLIIQSMKQNKTLSYV